MSEWYEEEVALVVLALDKVMVRLTSYKNVVPTKL